MACFPQMMARLYAYGVVVADGSTPTVVKSKLGCMDACVGSPKCSSFFYRQNNNSCNLHNRWVMDVVTNQSATGFDYFILLKEGCDSPGYEFVRSLGMCLKFSSTEKDWDSAKESCESGGARLVQLDSKEKMDGMSEIMEYDYWIGARLQDTQWEWTDGSRVEYFKWAPDQPEGTGECLQLWLWYRALDDYNCLISQRYICEKI